MEGMVYVAEDPNQPGAAWSIFSDEPCNAKHLPKWIAGRISDGSIIRHVPIDVGIEMVRRWVRSKEKHG